MRLVDPSTPTLVLTADGKLFFPVIDPPYFFLFSFLFEEGKKSRTIRVEYIHR